MQRIICVLLSRTALAGCALLAFVASCGQSTGPASPSKLLVTNTTCGPGGCATFRVLAFPENQPRTPGGLWSIDLGSVNSASACLTIPPSATFKITDAGTGATTTLKWTTAQNVSIGVITPNQSAIQASPSTGAFVPTKEAGWGVALPGNATPVAVAPCQ